MKIAIVFDGLGVGGIERVGADYAKIFLQLGYQVDIYNLQPALNQMEVEFPQECNIKHFYYSRKFAPEQYTQLVKKGFLYKMIYPFIYGSLNIFNSIYKVLFRFMNKESYDLIIAFSSHFNDLTFVQKNYLRNSNKMCWLHGALYSYCLISDGFLNLYKKIKNLIVLVDDAQEEVLCYNDLNDLKIFKLYNPTFIKDRKIDIEKVELLKKKYGDFAIMVSRFEYPHKDHYTVSKAVDIVRNKFGKDLNLLFLGSGPDEKKVQEYVNTLGDTKNHIYFLGNVSDVQNYYNSAKLLLHASVAGEGLPTIIIEALAYKLPCIVTDSKTGPREILGDNEYGLLSKVQDPDDMAQKIQMIFNDEKLYNHFKISGENRVKDFSPDTIKENIKEILKKIINRR